jgi:ABC-type dipeptide/oligopeptide/nickel transport system permease subunit
MGASDLRVVTRHILPNAIGTVAVAATVMTANAIALETTLSYLGFGISRYAREDKRIPSLGDVMADANVEGLFHWWGLFFPGLILVLILMSVYFVGDGLRDAQRRYARPRRQRRDMKIPRD